MFWDNQVNVIFSYFLNFKFLIFTCLIWNMRKVLVWWEKWKKIIADFHVLGLFMAKKHDLSDKKISVCHVPLSLPYAKFVLHLQARFRVLESFGS
jgi:hypothetical protein